MKLSVEHGPAAGRSRQRGGARLNFLLVMLVLGALVYVGAQYVPARYRAWQLERFMQDTVETAVSSNKTPAWVEEQLRQNFDEHSVPEGATVEVARDGRRMRASVRYELPISLLVTDYEHDFDVTVLSVRVAGGM